MNDDALSHYGFLQQPFRPVMSVEQIFRTDLQGQLVSDVVEDVVAAPAFVAVRGEAGVGKTSFLTWVAFELQAYELLVVPVPGGVQSPLQVQRLIGEAAGIPSAATMTPDQVVAALQGRHDVGRLVLLFDDADALPGMMFRYLSLLQKLFEFQGTSLSVVLVGNSGQWSGLQTPDLEAMRRACFSRYAVLALSKDETAAYLEQKMRLAGQTPQRVMTKAAASVLANQADGLPARIEELAERALAQGFRKGSTRVTTRTVHQALPGTGSPLARLAAKPFTPWAAAAVLLVVVAGTAALLVERRQSTPEGGGLQASVDSPAIDHAAPVPAPVAVAEPPVGGVAEPPAGGVAELPTAPPVVTPPMVITPPVDVASAAPPPPVPDVPPDLTVAPPRLTDQPAPPSDVAAAPSEQPPETAAATGVPVAEPTTQAAEVTPSSPTPGAAQSVPSAPVTSLAEAVPIESPAAPAPADAPPVAVASSAAPAAPPQVDAASQVPALPSQIPTASNPASPAQALPEHGPADPVRRGHGGPGLVLVAGPGDNMATLYAKIYRGMVPPPYSEFRAANRTPIKPGALVIFPEPPNGWLKY